MRARAPILWFLRQATSWLLAVVLLEYEIVAEYAPMPVPADCCL